MEHLGLVLFFVFKFSPRKSCWNDHIPKDVYCHECRGWRASWSPCKTQKKHVPGSTQVVTSWVKGPIYSCPEIRAEIGDLQFREIKLWVMADEGQKLVDYHEMLSPFQGGVSKKKHNKKNAKKRDMNLENSAELDPCYEC